MGIQSAECGKWEILTGERERTKLLASWRVRFSFASTRGWAFLWWAHLRASAPRFRTRVSGSEFRDETLVPRDSHRRRAWKRHRTRVLIRRSISIDRKRAKMGMGVGEQVRKIELDAYQAFMKVTAVTGMSWVRWFDDLACSLKHGPRSTGRVFRNLQFPTNRLQTDSVPSAKLPKDCSPHSPFSRRTDPP
jgi:hypothetical protein|tara:strand:+ start:4643 stop:5215 length:573 start_codon:yes stop_codon:yes gene_type:complete